MNTVTSVEIAPQLRGAVSKLDLISPTATLWFATYRGPGPGYIFRVSCAGYALECCFTGDVVELRRDISLARLDLAKPENRSDGVALIVQWSPTILGLTLKDRDGKREHVTATLPTFPPNALLEWARREALAPVVDYPTPVAVYEEVVTQLKLLHAKIVSTDAIKGFWDKTYEGNAIIARRPKREPDSGPAIRAHLYDLELQTGLQAIPQYEIGSGRLDFLITGRTHDGQTVYVCVEFKLAHAQDLVHGLQVQLPEYMNQRATDYGIYVVLDFGADYPADMSKFNLPRIDAKNHKLGFILPLAVSETGRKYVRALLFELGPRTAPSRL